MIKAVDVCDESTWVCYSLAELVLWTTAALALTVTDVWLVLVVQRVGISPSAASPSTLRWQREGQNYIKSSELQAHIHTDKPIAFFFFYFSQGQTE